MKYFPELADNAEEEAKPPAKIGWAQGVLSDGRSWFASLWEDDEGDRTLSISYPATGYEDEDEETLIQRLLDESLVVPLADGIEYFVAEKRDDLFSPDPIWMIEILLSDDENEWARPGFVVRDLNEYRVH
jgi:hypothetical protein